MRIIHQLLIVVTVALGLVSAVAADIADGPDAANEKYGPHERNVIDVWRPKSDKPTPVVIWIHGGGFVAGDKRHYIPSMAQRCLDEGMAFASMNYRYSTQAPFPGPMLDAARAVQYVRHHAAKWNIDPTRIAVSGGSAGAGMSLWVAFRDDMADPMSDDPVARESTRVTAAVVYGAQSSYDPRFIKTYIGGRAHEHPALLPFYGLKANEIDTPRAHRLYEQASPINFVTKDDPPVLMLFNEPTGPLPDDAKPGDGIHHINFGHILRRHMSIVGVECLVRHFDDDYGRDMKKVDDDVAGFLKKQFGLDAAKPTQ